MVKQLTDEQVTEIQLAENLQRENPHPMDEAQVILLMQQTGKAIEEIAIRLGKSKQFVYTRLKLLNLIDAFQEMFFAELVTIQQALDLATISREGQQEFFDEHCAKWKTEKHFQLPNLQYALRQYKYDLKNAPFNTKDKKLVPEAGACSTCPFNSATLKSLFPEYAKQAICTNTACYEEKCTAHVRITLALALKEHRPVALLLDGELSHSMEEILIQLSDVAAIPRYDRHDVTVIQTPALPDKDDYTFEYSDDEPEFEKDRYDEALHEYEAELAEYQEAAESGRYQKALVEQNGEFIAVLFSPEPPPRHTYNNTSKGVTMKLVQEALKAGTVTPALLQKAIDGMVQREKRAKQIDRDRVQLNIHKQFEEKIQDVAANENLTNADIVAARLLVYQSLDYDTRRTVHEMLFTDSSENEEDVKDDFYQKLLSLTDQQYSYMIRMAIACKTDSKYPHSDTGLVLYKVAEAAGINVEAIEKEQEQKAITRHDRVQGRVKELERKIEKLQRTV